MKLAWLLVLAISAAPLVKIQDKNLTGDFSKSPTEHIIVRMEEPFVVRSINGLIIREQSNKEPLTGVLFEIQGPGDERTMRQATTDEHGRFKMGRVPLGTYKFKATFNGFQSVMGTIVVSKAAAQKDEVKIEMRVGM
ncbi:MAG TPA: carboxypeptidase-like regulatory domain-containing protein [Candidatus Acidoferrales bacterium]|nr:carboxypeptidase-like regulatory domain-containing protein [Candidatus Acidoferrales bacterium]